jgi:hypothetical protein
MYSAIGGTQPAGSEGLVTEGFLDSNGNANFNYAIDGCSGTVRLNFLLMFTMIYEVLFGFSCS